MTPDYAARLALETWRAYYPGRLTLAKLRAHVAHQVEQGASLDFATVLKLAVADVESWEWSDEA